MVDNSVRRFLKKVAELHEPEYGDFKRKVGLYLADLRDDLKTVPDAVRLILQLDDVVIYNPDGNVEKTRQRVLKAVEPLLNLNQGSPL
jgi:hypothetical protein